MVDRRVRQELLQKLKVTKQALSQKAKRIKERFGPMTTDEAIYVIAHREGVDLSKHLPLAVIDRIRSLIPREVTTVGPPVGRIQKRREERRPKVSSYPLVRESLVRASLRLGNEVYPQMFVLENSIRALIQKRLAKTGNDWWDKLAPGDVRNNVQRTMTREKRYRHREPRGNQPLYYSNFDDLKKIVLANQSHFQDVIQDFEWFRVKMEEVYMVRNNIGHCVPLSDDDSARLFIYQREWARLLQAAGES